MTRKAEQESRVVVKPLAILTTVVRIRGTAPYVQHKFSQKALDQIRATQEAGQQAKGKKVRKPKDFDEVFEGATHVSTEGWYGIPAHSFRAAMIRACSLIGFKMTMARLSFWVKGDGFDDSDGAPLVKIHGTRERHQTYARNANGQPDLRDRPMWRDWFADLTVQWDEDQFSGEDMVNLLRRAGLQVGIGEGRPGSKNSAGCGWGTFDVDELNPKPGSKPKDFRE